MVRLSNTAISPPLNNLDEIAVFTNPDAKSTHFDAQNRSSRLYSVAEGEMLNQDQLGFFKDNGYLIMPGLLDKELCGKVSGYDVVISAQQFFDRKK